LWKHIIGKYDLEDYLIARNFKQFSHADATSFGCTDMGKELGHTGDLPMAQAIYDGNIEHAALIDNAIHEIV
jgi:hypothetical protein